MLEKSSHTKLQQERSVWKLSTQKTSELNLLFSQQQLLCDQ